MIAFPAPHGPIQGGGDAQVGSAVTVLLDGTDLAQYKAHEIVHMGVALLMNWAAYAQMQWPGR